MMVGVTDDEAPGHRHERPEDWGWHGEFGRWARVAGWLSAALLVVLNFTTHYNLSGVYEKLGEPAAAFRHLRTYRTLIQGG